jgi:secondary thiamine-phosphate synthase enzyme
MRPLDGSWPRCLPRQAIACYAEGMQQFTETSIVQTRGQGFYEVSDVLRDFVSQRGVSTGLATVFVRHTSCSLVIQENADPDVQTDLMGFFRRLVPEGMDWLVHTTEGPDDMPAHIKAALTQTSIGIPIIEGRPVLGTWQGLYLFEHRKRPHRRELVFHLIGG